VLYVKEIFENWIRVVNKNQNTKPIKQPSKQVKTAGDSTMMKNEARLELEVKSRTYLRLRSPFGFQDKHTQ
jgi:hypothetical protein